MGLREQLQAVHDLHQHLTPELVVDVARPPEHPLHQRFEWDDTVAAERFRRGQAAELIRSVRITYRVSEDRDQSVRAFSCVRENRGPGNYVPTDRVLSDPLQRRILLADCRRDWQAFQAKYACLEEFAEIVLTGLERTA